MALTDEIPIMPSDVLARLLEMFRELHGRILARRRRRSRPPGEAPGRQVSPLLQSLQRGEISLDDFLSHKIDRATLPLRALLYEDDVAFVRALLDERIDTDPVLSRLLGDVTRRLPPERRRRATP